MAFNEQKSHVHSLPLLPLRSLIAFLQPLKIYRDALDGMADTANKLPVVCYNQNDGLPAYKVLSIVHR